MTSSSEVTKGPQASRAVDDRIVLPAHLTLFGHEATSTEVHLLARSTGWRAVRTAKVALLFAVLTPLVGIIPPHAPWLVGAITAGIVIGRRRWTERFSVADFKAPCPRCDSVVALKPGTRFKPPQPVPCDNCGHEPLLTATLPA